MRKHFILALLVPLTLAASGGCSTLSSLPTSPENAANATVLDEQALIGAELAYKSARIALEIYVDSGHCTGACATRFRTLNTEAHDALLAARAAYAAANSPNYLAAIGRVQSLVNQLLTLTGRNS